jgi:hypothetical protein
MWVKLFIGFISGLFLIQIIFRAIKTISKQEARRLIKLFSGAWILLLGLGTFSFLLEQKKNENIDFFEFINKGKIDENFLKRILVGFGSGIVFGIIDNMGLWLGMDALDPILPKGILTKAGYGNVFSDSLSAFLSTFAGDILVNLTSTSLNTPLWAKAVGTFSGCLMGLYTSRLITGKQ